MAHRLDTSRLEELQGRTGSPIETSGKRFFPLALESSREVTFSKVKGHSGDRMNDFVDDLATRAADAQRGERA